MNSSRQWPDAATCPEMGFFYSVVRSFMLDLLRDPVWQFFGAAFAVLGIAVALWIYWLQRQTKELAFGIVSSRRLLSVADEVSSRVTVELDGKSVKNLHLLVYGLKNSGHRAISPNDFQRALKISFPEGQVISAEITSEVPSKLGATLVATESSIELNPLLLNSGDKLLIQVLLSASSPSESVDARIIDIPSLVPINTRPRLPAFFDSAMPIFVGVLILIAIGSYFLDSGEQSPPMYLAFFGLALFSVFQSFVMRLREKVGPTARRYVGET
ncbi:hypothetical protein [Nostoc sp. CHAB 5715]|uniref:hypothetical protein n=1 Tax=Nostoc sp. CHAB 5715 TaxID=2780400 RepID=UPI001E38CB16|nr:hypothetical protein [Nostoc sp. CHAB 5715]MCC5619770.1 hypothetical protein [Nostoc sp. CHAB 5836]MCC5626666.1 hypothetical protein [Nostoc sp. CHAB 5715]